MKTFFKVAVWIMAAVFGLFIWNVTPDFRPVLTWILAGAFICYVLSAIVEVTVKRLVGDELLELRRQSNATAHRLDRLDRKVTAILRDALEQRRLR
jgi:predicted PurR-regulated permease PerM